MRLTVPDMGWRAWVFIPSFIAGFVGTFRHGIGAGIGLAFFYVMFIAFIIFVSDRQRDNIAASVEYRVKKGLPPVRPWRWRLVAITVVFWVFAQNYIGWSAAILLSFVPIVYGGVLASVWKDAASSNQRLRTVIIPTLIMWAIITLVAVLSSGGSDDPSAYPCYGLRYTDC